MTAPTSEWAHVTDWDLNLKDGFSRDCKGPMFCWDIRVSGILGIGPLPGYMGSIEFVDAVRNLAIAVWPEHANINGKE